MAFSSARQPTGTGEGSFPRPWCWYYSGLWSDTNFLDKSALY